MDFTKQTISPIALLCFLTITISFIAITHNAHAQNWQNVTGAMAFKTGYFQVIGVSNGGQSKFEALRSATVLAQRDMLAAIQGIPVQWQMTIKDGMQKDKKIKQHVEGFLQGAQPCGQQYNPQTGSGRVCLRLKLHGERGIYKSLFPRLRKSNIINLSTN
ncbi:MAG: hypothetical protein HQL68_05030 [Magnetococcales bacterium]|nr:hypothetical protein [Magnetococcales bacterium]